MPSVPLTFLAPDDPDLVKLHIWESPSQTGPWSEIEVVTFPTGQPPTEYTTALAANDLDWFAISWEDDKGATSDLSPPVQGGTDLFIHKLVKRVMERNSTLDTRVVTQEAEAIIESFFGDDPYDPSLTATYQQLTGLTYLILARSAIATAVISSSAGSSDISSATLGLISFRSETSTASAIQKAQSDVEDLIDLANEYLGISTSFVMQLEEITTELGISSYDHSRLIGWVGLT